MTDLRHDSHAPVAKGKEWLTSSVGDENNDGSWVELPNNGFITGFRAKGPALNSADATIKVQVRGPHGGIDGQTVAIEAGTSEWAETLIASNGDIPNPGDCEARVYVSETQTGTQDYQIKPIYY